MAIVNKFIETFIATGYYNLMLEGFKNTIFISIGALAIGLVIGTMIAVIKYFAVDAPALRPLASLCDLYVTAVRGIPVVVLLLLFYYWIMRSSNNGVVVSIITFGVNSGAYMAELIRSGLNAVDNGQYEAGRALSMSRGKTMRYVILPQALRYIMPAIGNEMIALLKETSVAGYVAVVDLTRAGNLVRNNTFDQFTPLALTALVYLTLVVALTSLLSSIEKKSSRGTDNE